jgi:phosphate-selective porin OprO/OprP
MNFNKKLVVAVSGAVLLMAGQFALADSTTDIVDALVGKGVLTEEEGKLITKGHTSAKNKAGKVMDKNGTLSLSSENGDSTFAVNGRIQLDARSYDNDFTSANNTQGFDVRRAYLGVNGKIAKYYDYRVVANFADDDKTNTSGTGLVKKSNQIDEAYFGINYWKQASFRFGQQKMPFSLEEQTSSRFIDFQERSLLNKMVPAKEIGVQVHGVFTNGLFYGAAISTGEGKSNIEASTGEGVDLIGRVGINFAEAMGNKDNVYHLAVAGSTTDGMQSNGQELAFNSESRGQDNKGTRFRSERSRLGVEGSVALGPFKLQSEWIENSFKMPVGATNNSADMDGYYVSANYMITGEKYASAYKAGKYDRISPLKDFNPEGDGWGALEVGARFTSVDGKDLYNLNTSALASGYYAADSTTLGLKWIPTPYTRILLNYVDTRWEAATGGTKLDEKALTLRTQLDF